MNKKSKSILGQAVVEYLVLFGFMSVFGLKLISTLNIAVNDTVTSFAFALTQQLSVGVCEDSCFFNGFENK